MENLLRLRNRVGHGGPAYHDCLTAGNTQASHRLCSDRGPTAAPPAVIGAAAADAVIFQTMALLIFPLVALTLFAAGCATSDSGSRPARPGERLAEYRQLVVDLRKAALASRQSAEA